MTPGGPDPVEIYRRLLRIRRFDEAAGALQQQGAIAGPLHASTGQEATVVGACLALEPGDSMAGNHRSHGHPIAKGAALAPLMAELLGKRTGVCKGKGGSMHLADFAVGSLGESGIVGGGIPVATGAALGARVRGSDRVALCFFGDGASNQGTFHESLNMAALWKLPVVYLCENNGYAATTPLAASSSVENVADRAAAYGMPGEIVDGQDALAVYEVVAAAVARARAGLGPSLVEAKTYRYREHADGEPIPGFYREAEEIERWRQRDPLALQRQRLLDDGVLDAAEADAVEREVRAEVEAAVDLARRAAQPRAEEAFEDVYASPLPRGVSAPAASDAGGREITYLEALFEAQRQEMGRDERVILIGEDIALYEKVGVLPGLGAGRLWSAPISESGFAGMAVGAAMTGLRPIVDFTIAGLVYVAMDPLVSQAAKVRYMTGGQVCLPIVYRAAMWHGHAYGAQHSDRPYPLFMNVPGLKIVVPATPYDAKGLLTAAIRDDDPVLFFDDKSLWFEAGPVPEGDYVVPLGLADVRRRGSDVTIVAIASSVPRALEAAEELAADGVSAEVIDPRSLVPFDKATLLGSIARTGRLVVVDPANRTNGAAAEIAALAAEEAFHELRAPIQRVATPDVPIPFSPALEQPLYPNKQKIVAAVHRVLKGAE